MNLTKEIRGLPSVKKLWRKTLVEVQVLNQIGTQMEYWHWCGENLVEPVN